MMFDNSLDIEIINKTLKSNSWLSIDGFKYDINSSGYRNFVFGCRAGPSVNIANLMHEIAHSLDALYTKKTRIKCNNWNLSTTKIHKFGAITSNITQLETRVFAIQKHLLEIIDEHGNMKESMEDHRKEVIELNGFLPDWYIMKEDEQLKFFDNEYRLHSKEDLKKDWIKVCNIIKQFSAKSEATIC